MFKRYGELPIFESIYQEVKGKLRKIAEILFHNDPIPFTVLHYFRTLHQESKKGDFIDDDQAIEHARRMKPLNEYYSNQIKNLESDRSNEADFLYTIKICYELGWDRTLDNIQNLQKSIFDSSSPQEPEATLRT